MSGRDPKDQRIEELEAEVAKLKDLLSKALARIAELEELLNKNSRNSSNLFSALLGPDFTEFPDSAVFWAKISTPTRIRAHLALNPAQMQ
jgi:hypothetical protein